MNVNVSVNVNVNVKVNVNVTVTVTVSLTVKSNNSKFQFDLDGRHFSHESLARVIAQALPVFDVKFTFTFNGAIKKITFEC